MLIRMPNTQSFSFSSTLFLFASIWPKTLMLSEAIKLFYVKKDLILIQRGFSFIFRGAG